MLIEKIKNSTAQDWYGKPLREIHDANMWRFLALKRAVEIMGNKNG